MRGIKYNNPTNKVPHVIILRIGNHIPPKRADTERKNMNTTAITLKDMQNTSEKEVGKNARARHGDTKTIAEKKEFVISQVGKVISNDMPDEFFEYTCRAIIEEIKKFVIGQVGEGICDNMPDEFFEHTYYAMHDYGMGFYESDRWAWLNTLFGYDIGADRARGVINWYYENGMDVIEITAEQVGTLQNIAELELGYDFDYTTFATKTPDSISYIWQSCDLKTIEEKKQFVISQVNEVISDDMPDEFFEYTYSAIIEEMKEFVISQVDEDISDDMPDEFFEHTYRAMHDYGMDFYESDRWAWLNTLFGYDIGADRARGIIYWYYENGMDVMDVTEITAEQAGTLQNIAEFELGYHFDYTTFAKETPDSISYTWRSHE